MAEEHVDFVPKPGVTIYVGGGRYDHDPKSPARIPKSVADGWEDHRHKSEYVPAVVAEKSSASAVKPVAKKAAEADAQA